MPDSLLVSDQHIDVTFLAAGPAFSGGTGFRAPSLSRDALVAPRPSILSGNNAFYSEQTLQGSSFLHQRKGGLIGALGPRPSNGEGTTLDAYLRRAKAALAKTAELQRAQKDGHFQEEMKWLAENKHQFLGRWVALQGQKLVAEGSTAKEVFSKVADRNTPPLVIRITEEELPFAGW